MPRACHRERHRSPEDPGPEETRPERSPEMSNLTIAAKYTRYLLTSLATVAFGLMLN